MKVNAVLNMNLCLVFQWNGTLSADNLRLLYIKSNCCFKHVFMSSVSITKLENDKRYGRPKVFTFNW